VLIATQLPNARSPAIGDTRRDTSCVPSTIPSQALREIAAGNLAQKIECPKHGTMYGYCSDCVLEGQKEEQEQPHDPEMCQEYNCRKCKALGR
jgi:hypothetical protein